jgi:hypothetical protein
MEMHSLGRFAALAIGVVLLLSTAARADKDPVSVRQLPAASTTQRYDADSPPDGLPVDPAEAGVTVSQFGCTALVDGQVVGQYHKGADVVASVRVETVQITLQLNVAEWIAIPQTRGIVAHEDGHRIISEHFYSHADVSAAEIGRDVIGHVLSASGSDEATAARNAMTIAAAEINRRYMAEVRDPCQRAQEAYDDVTGHGTKDVDEMDGIDWALRQVGK